MKKSIISGLCAVYGLVFSIAVQASDTSKIQVVSGDTAPVVRFTRLLPQNIDNNTQISGEIDTINPTQLPRGHIDLAAFTSSGTLIAETTANFSPTALTHTMRRRGGAEFSAMFEQNIPNDAIIKVAFHHNKSHHRSHHKSSDRPNHDINIAR